MKKKCKFCAKGIDEIDYKDVGLLSNFVSARGKILHRRITSSCAKHQRRLTKAIKCARSLALMPYLVR